MPDSVDSDDLEDRLGHRFDDRTLLGRALTHRSYANEQGLPENYERLELLGDSVLSLVTTEWLFHSFPGADEGTLSKRKAALVSAKSLAQYATALGMGERLLLGIGEERSGGRAKPSILADSLEAVFGAVFLDRGLDAARLVILPMLEGMLSGELERPRDPKSRLQELVQSQGWALPDYEVVRESGPDHEKVFQVACRVRGVVEGEAEGASKKMAEQEAARLALAKLVAT